MPARPDWHATVNGEPAPILSAYGAFKAVGVQPGASHVRFYCHAGMHSVCRNILTATAACFVAAGLLWLGWLIATECTLRRMGVYYTRPSP